MSRRVLIVDDDREMVRTLCDILALHGWTADGAHSGEEAVAAVTAQAYAAVVMDVRMGGMNGVEALRAMRRLRPGLPVILMTAYTAAELLAEAEREGALHIFPKPVSIDRLTTLLESTIATTRSVLVVDDNIEFLRTLTTTLRHRGFAVLEASTLEEAIALLERRSPGAVVLHLRLDNLEPRECVLAIKRVSPAVALILYSGHPPTLASTTAEMPKAWIRGALQKPFDPERLIELLHGTPAQ